MNSNKKHNKYIAKILLIIASMLFLTAGSAQAAVKTSHGHDLLLDTYNRNMEQLHRSAFGLPIVVESFEKDDKVHVDIYGILDYSFSDVVSMLSSPVNWRDIVFIHPNVKASSYREQAGSKLLTFYLGKKTYQPPKNNRQIICNYRIIEQIPSYLNIMLKADKGPFATKNHTMNFQALPLDRRKTFVHVSYVYSDSAALRLAARVYFATIGRGKVGFTVTGTDDDGKPEYIGGPRGALERSTVRYYFAILAFMDTLQYPEESRFQMRISKWHDLTGRFKRQLLDLDKNTYIQLKTREQRNQLLLQQQIEKGLP